jgi:hypothetical protein
LTEFHSDERHAIATAPSFPQHFCELSPPLFFDRIGTTMPIAKLRASRILGAFQEAEAELVGKAVVLSDGKAGTIEQVWLDELHGLRVSIRGHDGKWPVSTIKLAQG